ncbi:hypothetical protein HZP32_05660 [Elizabethkingia anophelis]|nr:hypothetical protein [Elizabethkingia anophelis]
MKYTLEYRVKYRHQKEFIKGKMRLNTLQKISESVDRLRKKYDVCEFKKYDRDVLVSTF